MDETIAYLLELRARVRGNPEARAIVDRCLTLIVRAREADAPTLVILEQQVADLRAELERRLGPPKPQVRH